MSRGKTFVCLAIILVGMLFVAAPWLSAISRVKPNALDYCPLDGTWVKKSEPYPDISMETVTRGGSGCCEWTSTVSIVNPDPTFELPFPPSSEADSLSSFAGSIQRTGLDTYEFRMQAYGTQKIEGKSRPQIKYICVFDGSGRFIDCDTRKEEYDISLFEGTQDADFDGMPDEGQTPKISFGPVRTVARRLVIAR